MRRVRAGALLAAALTTGCGGSGSHHAAATDSGVTRLVAICRQAQGELARIYERNIEHGAPSEHEVERELTRGGPAALAANFRRRMERAARESVAVLSSTGTRMGTLPLAKSDEGAAGQLCERSANIAHSSWGSSTKSIALRPPEKAAGGFLCTPNERRRACSGVANEFRQSFRQTLLAVPRFARAPRSGSSRRARRFFRAGACAPLRCTPR